jgi:thiosulfate/3-mercaptopyruvate sulfurtransferase
MKKYLLISVVLLACLVVSCVKVGTSPKGEESPIEKAAMKLMSDVKAGGYKIIGTEELNKWAVEKKDMLLIDTMPAEAFAKIRIKGAVNSPVAKTEKEFTPAEKENILKIAGNDKSKTVVVYCGYTSCRRSHLGAKTLVENGFSSVYRYPGGIVSWNEGGYPVEGADAQGK